MRTCILRDNANSIFDIKAFDGRLEISSEGLEFGDKYHTMHELYQHRMALNIALFHAWDSLGIYVIKSKLHHDGTMFEGNYFIVMALTDMGQVSYHYTMKHWDKFKLNEVKRAPEWDKHTSLDVMERLMKL